MLRYAIEWAGGMAVDALVRHLERRLHRGLRWMRGADLASWELHEDGRALGLPSDGPARLLLFVHGTFSSTVGSFGALAATGAGSDLLARARRAYDAVVGFDHATLSETPLANARDLMERLRTVGATPRRSTR
ncbi:MAG: hypothetical protein IT208_15555 [Chthonomonadales bacterium]|nr:hypothetical protein [Chthonomonadales bacterium]